MQSTPSIVSICLFMIHLACGVKYFSKIRKVIYRWSLFIRYIWMIWQHSSVVVITVFSQKWRIWSESWLSSFCILQPETPSFTGDSKWSEVVGVRPCNSLVTSCSMTVRIGFKPTMTVTGKNFIWKINKWMQMTDFRAISWLRGPW